MPYGVKKIRVYCGADNSSFYAQVTPGGTLTATQYFQNVSDDSSQSCYWLFSYSLTAGSRSYDSNNMEVGIEDYSSYIDISWSTDINNYTGSTVNLTE